MVTAANKMRMGQKITVSQNLTGKLKESWKVPTSRGPNEDNEKLITKFWSDRFGKSATPTTKGWVVPDGKSTRLNSSHSCAARMPCTACKKKTILTTQLLIPHLIPTNTI